MTEETTKLIKDLSSELQEVGEIPKNIADLIVAELITFENKSILPALLIKFYYIGRLYERNKTTQ